MKKTSKKLMAWIMSFVMLTTTLFSIGVNVATAATSGQCTNTINWSYDTATYTLTLTGTGVMPDYRATNLGTNKKSPWEENKVGNNTIKAIMKNLVVGEGITEIGEYNFYNCSALENVTLPSTLKSIDGMGAGTDLASASYGAFQNCISLEQINLPAGLQTIEPYAFKNCTKLKSIAFPDSLKTLGKCAFLLCSALETVTFGTGLTTVSESAFNSCGVKRINWGAITDISTQSFYACNIKDIEFPEQIKSIGARGFANNTSLMTVTINNASLEFKGTNNTTSNTFSGSNQTVTIIGHSASTAQTFANAYGYTFVSMDNCDHSNTREEIVTEPTCTEPGEKKIICNDCEFVVSDTEIEALGHNFVVTAENDSTTLDGHIYRSYECSRCHATNETVEHQLTVNITNAEDIGNISVVDIDGVYVWVDGYYTTEYLTEPTCTTPGIAKYTCTIDGCVNTLGQKTYERKVLPASHTVETWAVTPSTCTEEGSRTGICTVCGQSVTETIKPTGHSYDETDLIETVVDEESGHTYNSYRCKNCAQPVEEIKHDSWIDGCYETNVISAGTCTIPGLARDTCSICGATRTRTLPASGEHDYVEESSTEPDCTKMGSKTYRCQNCDQKRVEYVPALGHDYIVDEELSIEPTCTTSGKEVSVCTRCAAMKTEILDPKGHTPSEETYVVITEPTCTKTGVASANCSVCGVYYEATLEALGHDYQDVETADLAPEGKPGHVRATPTCTRCGATQNTKLVHKEWIEGYYTSSGNTVATCTSSYYTDTCSIDGCLKTRINELPGIGHDYFYVTQTYEGVSLMCRHCLATTVVEPDVLMEYWGEANYINQPPNRTETDNSGYLDLDRNGIINAKDYARILKACQKAPQLIEEHEQKMIEDYGREYANGGELTAGKDGKVVTIEDNEGTITPGYEFTFTPTKSGTYSFYSTATVDTSSINIDPSQISIDSTVFDNLDLSQLEIDTSDINVDTNAAVTDPMAFLTIDGEDTWAAYDDNSGSIRHFKIFFECEEGVTYRLRTGFNDPQATGSYKVVVMREGTEEENYNRLYVEGGELSTSEYTGKEVRISDGIGYDFTFTPTKSGKYRFYSASAYETFAYLELDGASTYEVYAPGGSLNTFSLEYDCEAGETYHIKTGFADETQTGTYRVFVVAPLSI